MSALRRPLGLVAIIGCALTACSSPDDASSPSETTSSASAPLASTATTVTSGDSVGGTTVTATTGSTPAASELTFGPGPFDLPDPRVGLNELTGYSATATVTFEGTRNGAAETWTRVKTVEVGNEPRTRNLTTVRTGDETGNRALVEVGSVAFEQIDDGPCTATLVTDGAAVDPDDPTAALPGFLGADVVGSEPVGAISATHYTFDERALGSLDPAAVTGDVWVADESGVVLRYSFVADGTAAYFGAGVDGRMTIDYELSVIEAPTDVVAPAGCPPGLIDVEPLPDAQDITSAPGYLSFSTATPAADVLASYQQVLAADGWVAVEAPLTTGDSTLLAFEHSGATLTVSIIADPAGNTVTFVLTNGPG